MEITTRDVELTTFLRKGFIADAQTIDEIFFHSYSACSRRLIKLYRHNLIQRKRKDSREPYIYYLNQMPTDFKKGLLRSKLFAALKNSDIEIIDYYQNYKLSCLTIDLIVIIKAKTVVSALLITVKAQGVFKGEKIEEAFKNRVVFKEIAKKLHQIYPVHTINVVACCPQDQPENKPLKQLEYHYIDPENIYEGVAKLVEDLNQMK